MNQPTIKPYETLDELHRTAANAFCELAQDCVDRRGVFSVSLSGGSTPKRLYEILSQRDLPWPQIHWFWGDERNVPHDQPESNYRMVLRSLLDRAPVPEDNVHAVPVDGGQPDQVARTYESVLRGFFVDQTFPVWDLVLLGMGDDAHTASLFPETKAIKESERWFVENWVEKFNAYRYTLTAPAINSAREIWFLVSGQTKREAVANVLGKDRDPSRFPSQLVNPTRWFVTRDAVV